VVQKDVQLLLTEIAVAWHHTKLIMDTELIDFGVVEEEMHLPQRVGKGKVISTQESVIQEVWNGWEDSVKMARRMWQVVVATL